MRIQPPFLTKKRLRTAGVVVGVSVAHLLVFAVIARTQADVPMLPPAPPINVMLFRPTPPPPAPPPPLKPTPDPGGGKPAAPSRIHVTPKPAEKPRELPAPPVPAPEPALVIGMAPVAGPTPGMGQGGTGNGTGTGNGDGEGSGSGGIGPRFIRGATQAEIFSVVPRGRRQGRGSVSCVIRLDERLDGCRLVSETPPGQGFGAAAVTVAEAYFRFRPPMSASGRPVEGQRVTVFVQFGR
ncbi:energy transducer TonB [Brevundimonas sp. TWP2-3-4b2]|uniref:energy transducer TonB n=1 Tax=Brevundimonas sp. TWP2-3-4b2 TaxID=2804595 RepID=UPI003CEAA063